MVRGTSTTLDEQARLRQAAFDGGKKSTGEVESLVTPTQQAKSGAATRWQHLLLCDALFGKRAIAMVLEPREKKCTHQRVTLDTLMR